MKITKEQMDKIRQINEHIKDLTYFKKSGC